MLLKIVTAFLALDIVNSNPDDEGNLCPDFDSFDRPIQITSETCKNMSSYGFALPPVYNIFKYPKIDFIFRVGRINDSSTNDTCLLEFSLTINTCTVYVTQFKNDVPFYVDQDVFLKAKRETDQLQLIAYDQGELEVLLNSTECNDNWDTQQYFSFILESNVTKNESNCIFTTIPEEFALLYDKKQHHEPVEIESDGSFKALIKMIECREYCFLILMGQLILLIFCFAIFFYALSKVLRWKRDVDSPNSNHPEKEKKQEGNKKKRKESKKESMKQRKESQKTDKKDSKKQSAKQSKKSPKKSTAPTQTNNLKESAVSGSTVLDSRF